MVLKKGLCLTLIIAVFILCIGCSSTNTSLNSNNIDAVITETIIPETIITETIQNELIQTETISSEEIIRQSLLLEEKITQELSSEKIIVESISVNYIMPEQFDDALFNSIDSEVLNYDINWPSVITKFAIGTGVILICFTITLAFSETPLAGVLAFRTIPAAIGAISGGAIGGSIEAITNTISEGGKLDQVAKYSIEGIADGYMWGAITGALLAPKIESIQQSIKPLVNESGKQAKLVGIIFSKNGIMGRLTKDGKYLSLFGKQKGTIRGNWLINNEGKTIGQIDKNRKFINDWDRFLGYLRAKGVKLAWKDEQVLVRETGRGTYPWTDEQIVELLDRGSVKGFEGYHINFVKNFPDLADNPNNIRFMPKEDHLPLGHQGNFQLSVTVEKPLVIRNITK